MTRRIGRWTYDPGAGWRLDGTDVLIDFDRLERHWYPVGGPRSYQPVDRYLDATMRFIEENLSDYTHGRHTPERIRGERVNEAKAKLDEAARSA